MIRSRMTHRCTIERNQTVALDANGNEQAAVWATHIADQPCYYYHSRRWVAEQQGERNVRVYGHQALLPLGTDVDEADRINGISDRRGTIVAGGAFNIAAIVRKPDHLLLRLESVT